MPRDPLGHPISDPRHPTLEVIQVEPTDDRSIVIDEDREDALPSLLLGQQGTMVLRKRLVELIASVGDRPCEVGAVLQLERTERLEVPGVQTLKVVHASSVTWVARLAPASSPQERSDPGLLLRAGRRWRAAVGLRSPQIRAAIGRDGALPLGAPVVAHGPPFVFQNREIQLIAPPAFEPLVLH